MLYISTLLLFTRFFARFFTDIRGVKKKKSVVLEKYILKKQIELEKLRNIVLFKFIYFFQIIGFFISYYYIFYSRLF